MICPGIHRRYMGRGAGCVPDKFARLKLGISRCRPYKDSHCGNWGLQPWSWGPSLRFKALAS